MKLGLSQLIDPRLLPLVDTTRAFYEKCGPGRGPSTWDELQSARDVSRPPAPSNPPAVTEVVGCGDRTVPVRIHSPTPAAPNRRAEPDISPIYADLANLPPVLIVEEDILLDDNLAMAARRSAAGIDIDLRVYPAAPHGFTAHETFVARAALEDIHLWLGSRFGRNASSVSSMEPEANGLVLLPAVPGQVITDEMVVEARLDG